LSLPISYELEHIEHQEEFSIKLNRFPGKDFRLKNINVLLGANGSGKSSTLLEIRDAAKNYFPDRTVIYVEGGRTIRIPHSLKIDQNNIREFGTLSQIENNHKNKKIGELSSRILAALILLDNKSQEIKDIHSDEVDEWQKGEKSKPMPVRPILPLNRLFYLFNEVFPSIKLELNPKDKNLICYKDINNKYLAQGLSDGEKQVLSILADIALLAEPTSLILVDEPELNLNSLLAVRLWESIENDLTDAVFVYTTHDVSFSMRPNIQNIYVLSDATEKISEINNIDEIDPEVLRNLLGSIPAILSTNRALITEGNPDSFDSIFYKWILGTFDAVIVPMGSSNDVVAVSNRTGVWKAIAPSVSLIGIIDRDFKSEDLIKTLSSNSTVVLEYHEAESYLCLPEIVNSVAEKMGLVQNIPSIKEIESIIQKEFELNRLKTIAKRVFEKTTLRLSVSIAKSVLDTLKSNEELNNKILEDAKEQLKHAVNHLEDDKIKAFVEKEIELFDKVIKEKSIKEMLKLTPGKSLLDKLSKLSGAKNMIDYSRACTKHIKVESVTELIDLRQKLSKEVSKNKVKAVSEEI